MNQLTDANPITYKEVQELSAAFGRSADWLEPGELHGPAKTHPLVGSAEYRRAEKILRAAAFLWAENESEV